MISFEWYRSFIEVYRVGTVSGQRKFSTSRNRLLANTSQQESQLWEIPCFKGLRDGWFPQKREKDSILKLQVRSRNSNQFPTKTQPPKLRKPSESVGPNNFAQNEFSVNYRRTIALFTPYNLG
ncbi:hypothetical protein [Oscillatoria nigro-viridis]|uniref:hypothetical protein n=1 Tax=Phormidium nigroviride TaxID=482564 RepID=UPI0021D799BC|nr:hypothetical protein [Oscillatoria nigro-viridis]